MQREGKPARWERLRTERALLSTIAGLPVGRAAAVAPCLIGILAVLALITIFPGFVTWLPNLLM